MDLINDLDKLIESKIDRSKWQKWKFSDLVENINEKVVPKDSGLDHYIGLEHLDSGSLHIRRFGETKSLIGDKLKIYKGDIIFAKRNAYLKRVAIAKFDAVASAHSLVLRAKQSNVEPEFLPFLLMSETFWTKAIEISVGSLSPTINWPMLAKQEFILPPKNQQMELADLIWSADAALIEYQKMIRSFEELISALRIEIFSANAWAKVKLKDRFNVQLGKMLSAKFKTGQTPFFYLANQNIQWGSINLDKLSTMDFNETERVKFSLKPGDLMVCEGGEVGRTAIWSGEVSDCYYQKALHRLRVKNDNYLPEVMLQFMYWANSQGVLKALTGHSTIAHLTAEKLKEMLIPDIPLQIQYEIKNKIEHLNNAKLKIHNQVKNLKQVQISIINKVFSNGLH